MNAKIVDNIIKIKAIGVEHFIEVIFLVKFSDYPFSKRSII